MLCKAKISNKHVVFYNYQKRDLLLKVNVLQAITYMISSILYNGYLTFILDLLFFLHFFF